MIASTTVPRRIDRRSLSLPILFLSVLATAYYSYTRGQDLNWDQLNYHFYIPWALFHGRMHFDLAPAAIQSYFNPAPYIPFYLLVRNVPPVAVGLILGAVHGVNYWLVALLAWRLTAGRPPAERLWATAAATAVSVASPMALSEIGTSFADILLCPLVLWSLLLLTREDAPDTVRGRRSLVGAAFLFGAATSLKLTFAPYALGFLAASMAGAVSWRGCGRALAQAALGSAAGFILVGGAWYAKVWVTFGNPFFPYYNGVFASPDYAPTNIHDMGFMPKSVLDGLSYPFLWTVGQPILGVRLDWRDIRFVLLIALGVTAALTALFRLRSGKPTQASDRTPGWPLAHRQLAIFFAVAFVVWLYEFGIQRYAVPLELALGPLVIVLLMNVLRGPALRFAGLGFALVSVLTIEVPDWYHVEWSSDWYGFPQAAPEEPALYMLAQPPMSYAVPFLPKTAHAVWIAGIDPQVYRGRFAKRLDEMVANMPTIHLVTWSPIPKYHLSELGKHGLYFAGNCRKLHDRAERLMVCDLTKDPSREVPTDARKAPATIAPGKPVFFSADHAEDGLAENWGTPEGWGVWGLNADPTLSLRIDSSAGPGPFPILFHGQTLVNAQAPKARIEVIANDREVDNWQFDIANNEDDRLVCVPGTAMDANRRITLRFHNPEPRSPAALGLGDDLRPLSIGLRSIELLPATGVSAPCATPSAP